MTAKHGHSAPSKSCRRGQLWGLVLIFHCQEISLPPQLILNLWEVGWRSAEAYTPSSLALSRGSPCAPGHTMPALRPVPVSP